MMKTWTLKCINKSKYEIKRKISQYKTNNQFILKHLISVYIILGF